MLKAGDLLGQHPHLLLEGGGDIEPGDINRIKAWLESIEKHIAADGLVNALNEIRDLEPILESP